MTRLILKIEFQYDENIMHSGDSDLEAREWFYDVLLTDKLQLWSNEIGDYIGTVTVLQMETAVKDGK